jgi:hypothetical protein
MVQKKPLVRRQGLFRCTPVTVCGDGLTRATLFAVGYRTNPESFSPHNQGLLSGDIKTNKTVFILIQCSILSIEKTVIL